MKQKIATVIGMVLLGAGVVIGCFAFPQAELIGFAVSMFGAGVCCVTLWKARSEKAPKWVAIVSIVLVGGGSFIVGFLGLVDIGVFKEIIGYIIAVVAVIAGFFIQKKVKDKENVRNNEDNKSVFPDSSKG